MFFIFVLNFKWRCMNDLYWGVVFMFVMYEFGRVFGGKSFNVFYIDVLFIIVFLVWINCDYFI